MTIAEVPAEARAAVLARRRKEIDELDYRRELRRLDQHGYSQREIAKWLGIAQPSVLSALRTAAKVPMPLDGFSGATPYEICQRYAAGFIDRAKLVDELTRFPYVKGGQTDGYDSLIVDPAGTWSEVSDAARRGLIEDDVYEEVFNGRHGIEQHMAEQVDSAPMTGERHSVPEAHWILTMVADASDGYAEVMNEAEVVELTGSGAPAEQIATKAAAIARAREIVGSAGGGVIHVQCRNGSYETNVLHANGRIVDRSSTAEGRPARRL